MENFDSVIEVIHEAISGYLEVFTTKEDVERAIMEDMSVMEIPYTLFWKQDYISNYDDLADHEADVVHIPKLIVRGKYLGTHFFMEFYFKNAKEFNF